MSFLDRARAPIAALCATDAALVLANGRSQISNDTWLNLVWGREIASGSLIRHNSLTVLARGVAVCDQQWLAHLAWYEVHQAGGFAALLVMRAVLSALTLALACLVAVRAGATPGRTALAGLLVLPLITANAAVRAQAFGELAFVGLVWLFQSDGRSSSARTWLAIPLVALWTNLHGSVLVGIVVAAIAAGSRPIDAGRGRSTGGNAARDIALALGVGLAVFASPYATSLPGYFRTMVGNPVFAAYVTEYKRPGLTTDPWVFVVAIVALVAVARARRSLRTFEIALTLAVVIPGVSAVRYGVFLALGLVLVLPHALDAALPSGFLDLERVPRMPAVAALLAIVAVLVGSYSGTTLDGAIARDLPAATATELSRRAGARGLVFASENYADVLLWYRPELRGRVAFDARLDLLPPNDLEWVAALQSGRSAEGLERYSVVAVDKTFWLPLVRSLSRFAAWRIIADDATVRAFARAE